MRPEAAQAVPRFTVIMPVFNAAHFFTDVLDSIPADLDDDFEIVLIDDCSTDGTAELIRRHPRFPKIALLRTAENSGPATARNLGAERARGEYLLFFDADVVFLPDTFERARAYVLAHPEVRCFTGINSKESAAPGFVSRFHATWSNYLLDLIPEGGVATQWNPRLGFIRKDFFRELGGFDARYRKADVEDYAFTRKIGRHVGFTRDLEIKHRFADLPGTMRNFYKRSQQWMDLLVATRELDKTGHTRTSMVPNVIVPVLLAAGLLLLPFYPTGRPLLLVLAFYVVYNLGMTLHFLRVAGLWRTPAYLFLHLCFHLAAAAGIAVWAVKRAAGVRA
ncbi:MAG: glycosyltransferase family 2 protein [Elusimicrobiota bacterium]